MAVFIYLNIITNKEYSLPEPELNLTSNDPAENMENSSVVDSFENRAIVLDSLTTDTGRTEITEPLAEEQVVINYYPA